MRDPVNQVLETRTKTYRALKRDMRHARLSGNWRELAAMRRFLLKMIGDEAGLYKWAMQERPWKLRNPQSESFESIIRRMEKIKQEYIAKRDSLLEAILTAQGQQRRAKEQALRREQERCALALRSFKADAKRVGIWSEAHDENFDDFLRLPR